MFDGRPEHRPGTGGTATGSPASRSTAANEYLVAIFDVNFDTETETYTDPGGGYAADPNGINSNGNADIGVAYGNSANGTETGGYGRTGVGSAWGVLLVAFMLAGGGGTDAAVTMGSALAVTSAQAAPQLMSLTGPAYAATAADLGGGSGAWVSASSAQGPPDGSFATWTAP